MENDETTSGVRIDGTNPRLTLVTTPCVPPVPPQLSSSPDVTWCREQVRDGFHPAGKQVGNWPKLPPRKYCTTLPTDPGSKQTLQIRGQVDIATTYV